MKRKIQRAGHRRLTVMLSWPLHERFVKLCEELKSNPESVANALFVTALTTFFEEADKRQGQAQQVHVVSPEVLKHLG